MDFQKLITDYFNDFVSAMTLYDYLGMALLVLFFIFFIVLAVSLRQKTAAAIFFSLLAFVTLLAGPFGVKEGFDELIRKTDTTISEYKKLNYSNALVVKGKLKNSGKIDFSRCKLHVRVLKVSDNKYMNYLNRLRPVATKTQPLDKALAKGDDISFDVIIDNFTYQNDFNVTAKGECYP